MLGHRRARRPTLREPQQPTDLQDAAHRGRDARARAQLHEPLKAAPKPGANVRASRRARAFENATTAPLPKGWKEHRDEDGVYYLEMKTGRTTTERPAA